MSGDERVHISVVTREDLDGVHCCDDPAHEHEPYVVLAPKCCGGAVVQAVYSKSDGLLGLFCPECDQPIVGVIPESEATRAAHGLDVPLGEAGK